MSKKPTYAYVITDGSEYLAQCGIDSFTNDLNRASVYATKKVAEDMLEPGESVVKVRVSIEKV